MGQAIPTYIHVLYMLFTDAAICVHAQYLVTDVDLVSDVDCAVQQQRPATMQGQLTALCSNNGLPLYISICTHNYKRIVRAATTAKYGAGDTHIHVLYMLFTDADTVPLRPTTLYIVPLGWATFQTQT
eukprot:GHVS01059175.1.p1 GENE.GHVS01059175.1~~GHVS01059175.1.p1  ORF type:complete len:128 (+),score=1.42 GHVS01059175.1:183-566(+)